MGSNKRNLHDYAAKYLHCPLCRAKGLSGSRDNWEKHIRGFHSTEVMQVGDIFWFNRHEAFYLGKHYKKTQKLK